MALLTTKMKQEAHVQQRKLTRDQRTWVKSIKYGEFGSEEMQLQISSPAASFKLILSLEDARDIAIRMLTLTGPPVAEPKEHKINPEPLTSTMRSAPGMSPNDVYNDNL